MNFQFQYTKGSNTTQYIKKFLPEPTRRGCNVSEKSPLVTLHQCKEKGVQSHLRTSHSKGVHHFPIMIAVQLWVTEAL